MHYILLSFLAVFLMLSGCDSASTGDKKDGEKAAQENSNDTKKDDSMKSENKLNVSPELLAIKQDPVCGMSMEQTPIADTLTYKGKLYGFCHPGCKGDFAKDPEGFLAKLSE